MPNNPKWKFPCIECAKPVKSNQKGIECSTCIKWVHLKCTNLTQSQYHSLEANENIPFYCLSCKPRLLYTDVISENAIPSTNSFPSLNTDTDNPITPHPLLHTNMDTSLNPLISISSTSQNDFSFF